MLDVGVDAGREDELVRFVEAGASAEGEFHCSGCGYGVSVRARLPVCPMCAGRVWEPNPLAPHPRAPARRL